MEQNYSSRDDLMQEALIHFWSKTQQNPGHTLSWYLQSCKFHLQHCLAAGRSVDSPKRELARLPLAFDSEEAEAILDTTAWNGDVVAEVSARDILSSLSGLLEQRGREILRGLAEGLGPCEIARKTTVSHPAVIKQRRKIATLAERIGISL